MSVDHPRPDLGARLGRMALSPVHATDDTRTAFDALEAITELRRVLDRRAAELVAILRADGMSWDDIAAAAGITREGARKRYGGAS